MMKALAIRLALLTVLAAVLPACDSGPKVETTTVGQELQDLDDARNAGLLTEAEYQKQRQKVLKKK